MRHITKKDIMDAGANLLGKYGGTVSGEVSDWERFAQAGLDYCWRYHEWLWTLRRGDTQLINGKYYMPNDFDYSGHRSFAAGSEASIYDGGTGVYLQYDPTEERYEVVNGAAVSLIYQVEPPELTDTVKIPFPSALTVAMAMMIYAKNGENPDRADISQEWDIVHVELDKLVAPEEKNKPRRRARTRQEVYGTFQRQ